MDYIKGIFGVQSGGEWEKDNNPRPQKRIKSGIIEHGNKTHNITTMVRTDGLEDYPHIKTPKLPSKYIINNKNTFLYSFRKHDIDDDKFSDISKPKLIENTLYGVIDGILNDENFKRFYNKGYNYEKFIEFILNFRQKELEIASGKTEEELGEKYLKEKIKKFEVKYGLIKYLHEKIKRTNDLHLQKLKEIEELKSEIDYLNKDIKTLSIKHAEHITILNMKERLNEKQNEIEELKSKIEELKSELYDIEEGFESADDEFVGTEGLPKTGSLDSKTDELTFKEVLNLMISIITMHSKDKFIHLYPASKSITFIFIMIAYCYKKYIKKVNPVEIYFTKYDDTYYLKNEYNNNDKTLTKDALKLSEKFNKMNSEGRGIDNISEANAFDNRVNMHKKDVFKITKNNLNQRFHLVISNLSKDQYENIKEFIVEVIEKFNNPEINTLSKNIECRDLVRDDIVYLKLKSEIFEDDSTIIFDKNTFMNDNDDPTESENTESKTTDISIDNSKPKKSRRKRNTERYNKSSE